MRDGKAGKEHERMARGMAWHNLQSTNATVDISLLGPGAMCLPKVVLEHAITAPEGFDLESYKESLCWSRHIGKYRDSIIKRC